jgi:hypothetical protein
MLFNNFLFSSATCFDSVFQPLSGEEACHYNSKPTLYEEAFLAGVN